MRRCWKKCDVDLFIEHLPSYELSSLAVVDDKAYQFEVIITNLLDKFAPVTEVTVRERNQQSWRDAASKVARSNARRLEQI